MRTGNSFLSPGAWGQGGFTRSPFAAGLAASVKRGFTSRGPPQE